MRDALCVMDGDRDGQRQEHADDRQHEVPWRAPQVAASATIAANGEDASLHGRRLRSLVATSARRAIEACVAEPGD